MSAPTDSMRRAEQPFLCFTVCPCGSTQFSVYSQGSPIRGDEAQCNDCGEMTAHREGPVLSTLN